MAYSIYLFVTLIFSGVNPQDCPKDYWGENCEKPCEIHCNHIFGCDKTSGTCKQYCDSGYWGSYCNQHCPVNCNGGCNMADGFCHSCLYEEYFKGHCNVSCSDKWPNCKTCGFFTESSCRTCKNGYWNATCDNHCPAGCYECDKNNGTCFRCFPKLWGGSCSKPCSGEHCSHCRLSDGLCEKCDEGYWGESCQNKCDLAGCEHSLCDKTTGNCAQCKLNYWGDSCNNTCEIKNCKRLSVSCPKPTGSTCYECDSGKWGSLCEYSCSETCSGKCQKNDGNCLECPTSKWGWSCENKCSDNCSGTCQVISGECDSCVYGTWGSTCNEACPSKHCLYCDKLSGHCQKCNDNFWGEHCNISCEVVDCVSLVKCSKTEGPKCYKCTTGKWGETCDKVCSEDCRAGCKLTSGECITDSSNIVQEDQAQDSEKTHATAAAISVATSFLVAVLVVLVVFVGQTFYKKRLKQRSTLENVTTASVTERARTATNTGNGVHDSENVFNLSDIEASPRQVSGSGTPADNTGYETLVESAVSPYDIISNEPADEHNEAASSRCVHEIT